MNLFTILSVVPAKKAIFDVIFSFFFPEIVVGLFRSFSFL